MSVLTVIRRFERQCSSWNIFAKTILLKFPRSMMQKYLKQVKSALVGTMTIQEIMDKTKLTHGQVYQTLTHNPRLFRQVNSKTPYKYELRENPMSNLPDLKKILMDLGNKLVLEHRFDPTMPMVDMQI